MVRVAKYRRAAFVGLWIYSWILSSAFSHAYPSSTRRSMQNTEEGIWFRGSTGSRINVQDELLRQFNNFKGIQEAFLDLIHDQETRTEGLGLRSDHMLFVVKHSRASPSGYWLSAIRRQLGGAAHVEYFPDNAAIVYCDSENGVALSQRDDVAFVSPLRSEWKTISLISRPERPDEDGNLIVTLQKRDLTLLSVNIARHEHEASVAVFAHASWSRLRPITPAHLADNCSSSTSVVHVNENTHEFVLSVPVICARVVAELLTALPRVLAVYEKPVVRSMNSAGNRIVTGGLPTKPNPFQGYLNGSGEAIHVADTGLDIFHCFFYDAGHAPVSSKNMVVTNSTDREARRKVVSYWSYIDDEWEFGSHGTHVSGTACGAVANTTGTAALLSTENGIAPNAKLAFTDLGCQSVGGCSCGNANDGAIIPCDCVTSLCPADNSVIHAPLSLDTGLFPYGPANAAWISSNSWGGGSSYGSSSQQIDRAVVSQSSMLVVFAAGNGGDSSTISEEGSSKNILTVGATTTSQQDFLDVLQNKVNPSIVGGHSFATNVLGCADSPIDAFSDPKCLYFLSDSFDACATDSYCGEGYSSGKVTSGCGCAPCSDQGNCFSWGKQYCSSCLVTLYKNIPAAVLASNSLAFFSSTGPTDDGRIKPDVVAPGYIIASSLSYSGSIFGGSLDVCGTSGHYLDVDSLFPHLFAIQGVCALFDTIFLFQSQVSDSTDFHVLL